MFKYILLFSLAVTFQSAQAQTPPTASQIENYEGLHQAAHLGDVDALIVLIETGADLDARDGYGRTPAHVAAFASNDQVLQILADAGADLNALENGIYDVVTIAAVANDPDLVELALKLGNRPDQITSVYQGTALIAAAHLGHVEVVEHLISAGAPLDHVNNLGWTALIESVVLGDGGPDHVATALALVMAGADINLGDNNGVTPLQHAQTRGFSQMIDVLTSGD